MDNIINKFINLPGINLIVSLVTMTVFAIWLIIFMILDLFIGDDAWWKP